MKCLFYSIFFLSQICYGQDTLKFKKLLNEAIEYENKGDFENSIKTQKKLFTLDSTDFVSANIIAGLYGKTNAFSEEIYWATKSLNINPGFALAYINLGNGYEGQGNISKAENYFNISLDIDSLSPYPYYSLGVLEEMKTNLNLAIVYYEKSVFVDSTFQDGYFNLAAAYANLKNFKKANENILKYLALNPNDKDALEMHEHIIEELLK
jgi:tetratricopeptide (TPR) repeat protein